MSERKDRFLATGIAIFPVADTRIALEMGNGKAPHGATSFTIMLDETRPALVHQKGRGNMRVAEKSQEVAKSGHLNIVHKIIDALPKDLFISAERSQSDFQVTFNPSLQPAAIYDHINGICDSLRNQLATGPKL